MEGILPPSTLNLRANDLSNEWRRWIRSFEDYLLAIDLVAVNKAAERRKLALFRHAGGEDVREVYFQMEFLDNSDQIIEEGKAGRTFEDVVKRFSAYCNPRSMTIVQRLEFHSAKQDGEQLDVFLMRLRRLAEGCMFEGQRDSLIRDKLLFGLDDVGLRDRLMRESDDRLTLDYVVKSVRINEAAKLLKASEGRQLASTSSNTGQSHEVDSVRRGFSRASVSKSGPSHNVTENSHSQRCNKCDRVHALRKCPAYNAKCRKCEKLGHWAVCCKLKQVSEVDMVTNNTVRDAEGSPGLYLDSVAVIDGVESNGAWYCNVKVSSGKFSRRIRFKLDTGAALTVCGPHMVKGIVRPTEKVLYGPGRTKLTCLGVVEADLTVKNVAIREEIFIVENQQTPLLSRQACESLNLVSVNTTLCDVGSVDIDEKLFDGLGKADKEYGITITPDAKPFALFVPRPIPFPLRSRTEAALQKMVDDGVITPVQGPTEWVAPMTVVPKANKDQVRICTDFSELNKFVVREVHPMATVESSLAMLGQARVFSKIDCNSGFWQIPLKEESSYLTTFLTHRGRFRYLRLPQGLCSAPEIFQCEMNRIVSGIESIIIHMDDVLVCGTTKAEHDLRLSAVLNRFREVGMTLNKEKCQFESDRVDFLGYLIDRDGIHAGQRVQGIIDFPDLCDVKSLQSFLGLVNQYARFSSRIADLTLPLRSLLKKDVGWYWGEPQKHAFASIKEEFQKPPVLGAYDVSNPTIVTTDASGSGLGATLCQVQRDGSRRLIAAASRSLLDAETRYAAIEKEALGVCWAMDRFAQYILGMEDVIVETDHKPLVPLLGNMFLDRLPPRIQRFKLRLQRFSYTMKHISGKRNIAADALSRYTMGVPNPVDIGFVEEVEYYIGEAVQIAASDARIDILRSEQVSDETLREVRSFITEGWPSYLSSVDSLLKPYWERRGLLTINKGLLVLGGSRVVIPLSQRYQVLQEIHHGHLGITKCQSRARQSVWWPSMGNSIERMIKSCRTCAEADKIPKEPLRPVATPSRPWEMVGSDLFRWNNKNFLLLVDYYSRYPEVLLLGDDTSSGRIVSEMKSVFARHGIPDCLISDNGPQYSSHEFKSFVGDYRFRHVTSSPYYPRSNGAAERMVQTVKNLLKKEPLDPSLALLSYRSSPVIGSFSPAELLMGRRLRTTVVCHPDSLAPQTVNHPEFKEQNEKYKENMKLNHDNRYVRSLRPLVEGEKVLYRNGTGAVHKGKVVSTSNEASRQVQVQSETTGNLLNRNRSAIVTTRSGRVIKTLNRLIEEA